MKKSGLKVLLIDDTLLILQQLQSLLAQISRVVETEAVTSAEAALLKLQGYQPDVMFVDINMPGMNGIEMLRELNQSNSPKKPVVIMLTNHTLASYKEECVHLGADYFLDKSKEFMLIPSIVNGIEISH